LICYYIQLISLQSARQPKLYFYIHIHYMGVMAAGLQSPSRE